MSNYPWWVKFIAMLTGKTEIQVAWKMRNSKRALAETAEQTQHVAKHRGIGAALVQLLPDALRQSPAVAGAGLLIFVWYAVGVLVTNGQIVAFSGYTLRFLGATNGVLIESGEWWRVVTSCFVHHDLLHLGFNLYALVLAGGVSERLFGAPRTFVAFVITGALSMTASHLWYTFFSGALSMTSGGASGAVSGLIGFALIGGHRKKTGEGIAIRDSMIRWVVLMAVWGIAVPFVNNTAHGAGFVAGVALGAVMSQEPRTGNAAILGTWASLLVCIVSLTLHITSWSGVPAIIDGTPRFFFGKVIDGDEGRFVAAAEEIALRCDPRNSNQVSTEDNILACRTMTLIEPTIQPAWEQLHEAYIAADNTMRVAQAAKAIRLLSSTR